MGNEQCIRTWNMFADIYSKSLSVLQNWTLAINSGGAVAVLGYIAKPGNLNNLIIWSLGVFAIGITFGLLWALVNYFASFFGIKAFKKFNDQGQIENNKFDLPCSICCLNYLAWLFGALSLLCVPIGFILGFIEITKYNLG